MGIRGLTQAAAMELAKCNITVNSYCPGKDDFVFMVSRVRMYFCLGITETDMWNMIDEKVGKYQGLQKRQLTDNLKDSYVALNRTGKPEDVASLVLYLASEDSDYMTGQNVMINGGAAFS